MRICDNCEKRKPRRLVKVKDVLYGKGFSEEMDLCETCYQKIFGAILKKIRGF